MDPNAPLPPPAAVPPPPVVPPAVNAPAPEEEEKDEEGEVKEDDESATYTVVEACFTTEVVKLHLAPHELAVRLEKDWKDVTFRSALSGLQGIQAGIVGTGTTNRRTDEAVHTTFPMYFLTVKDDQVQVVYGPNGCIHTNQTNKALTALMGDKWRAGQAVRDPIVVSLVRSIQVQTNHFGGVVKAKAKELNAIVAELEANGYNGTLVSAEAAGEMVTALRCLPVHQSSSCKE